VKQQRSRWTISKGSSYLGSWVKQRHGHDIIYDSRRSCKVKGHHSYYVVRKDKSTKAQLIDPESFSKIDRWGQMILLGSLSEGASYLVQDWNTTYKMVKRMMAQYDSSSASSVLFKFNKAPDLSYQEGSNMSDHLGKLNSLINQIKSAGDITIENLHVVLMLRSIPETSNWKAVIENLKAQDEADLTKEKVARVLTERAAELAIKQVNKQTSELMLTVNPPSQIIYYQCGKTGNIARYCRSKGNKSLSQTAHGIMAKNKLFKKKSCGL
jgi:hypothetical protein